MTKPKRILLLDTGNEWGGGTNSMFELLKRIDRRRFAVTCCFYKDYRKGQEGRLLSAELADIGIPLMLLPIQGQPVWAKVAKELLRGLLSWSAVLKKRAVLAVDLQWRVRPRAKALQRVLTEGQFDLLYMNNQPSTNLEGYLAGEAAGVPVVQHCRVQPSLQPYEVAVANRVARRIIGVSQGVVDVLAAQQVLPELLAVVHNAIDCHQALPKPAASPFPPGTLVVGTVGRLAGIKSVDHLLEAVARLQAESIPVACLVLGEGSLRPALEQQVAALGIGDKVCFAGFQALPLSWVQAMDICVLCSSKEGLPRVVLEGMLAGKPVVGSEVTGTRELVVHEQTGLLYPYGDVPALTAALRRLLVDAGLRRTMGEAGRQRVADKFSIEAYVAGVSRVLEEAGA